MIKIKISHTRSAWHAAAVLCAICLPLLLLTACSIPQEIVARVPAGEVLFRDDFADPASGWDQISAQNGETNYSDGAYRIWVNEPYTDLWANPHLQFQDVRIEVEASKAAGPDNNVFGLICRSNQAGDQYYFFVISSDGYYGIGKVKDQGQTLLSADKMLPSEAIHQKKAANLLRADCIGDRLAFYVNDTLLSEVQDGEYPQGDIGLTAGTFDEPNVDIQFDNISVTKP